MRTFKIYPATTIMEPIFFSENSVRIYNSAMCYFPEKIFNYSNETMLNIFVLRDQNCNSQKGTNPKDVWLEIDHKNFWNKTTQKKGKSRWWKTDRKKEQSSSSKRAVVC